MRDSCHRSCLAILPRRPTERLHQALHERGFKDKPCPLESSMRLYANVHAMMAASVMLGITSSWIIEPEPGCGEAETAR